MSRLPVRPQQRVPQQARRGAPPRKKPEIPRLETERFYMRTLRRTDASARWISWLADPEVMNPLNTRTRQIGIPQIERFIEGADNIERILFGIFVKSDDLHIGIYEVKFEPKHELATFNVVVGDKAWWGERVVLETRAALLDYVFDKKGVEKVVGHPPARNFPSVFNYRAQGWQLEGVFRSHRRAPDGGRIDQLQFGMLKDEWIERRSK